MFITALILFAVAAVAGLSMAILHFRGRTPPGPLLALLHGLFAASGLIVLVLAAIRLGTGGGVGIALGVLVVAALGGFALVSFDLRRRALPSGLVVGHGLLAVIGFVILLSAVFVTAG